MTFIHAIIACVIIEYACGQTGQTIKGIELGFPEAWNGDQFQNELCPSQNVPTWLNGYFLVQTSAAYGRRSDPIGKKITHMLDGLGAVVSLELENGQVRFSANYYPARPFKIWQFYERDMGKSKVSWDTIRTPFNSTSAYGWNLIKDDNSFPMHPNVDFWQVGQTVIGATEFVGVGMQFNVSTLYNFKGFQFKETNNIFRGTSSVVPLTMPVHERSESDGSIYAACAAFDATKNKMYQIIFKVAPDGTRTLEGMFDHGTYEPQKCTADGMYTGDKKVLAGYMHSITSTRNYVVLPVTSYILNPCKLPPLLGKIAKTPNLPIDIGENPVATEFMSDVPLRFLIFDKRNKSFLSNKPLDANPASFITHQFNAYEDDNGNIIADMIGTEGADGPMYDFLTPDFIMNRGFVKPFARLSRFRINLQRLTVDRSDILSDREKMSAEFPNYNRNFMERKYKYGYLLIGPYMIGSKIVKIDMDDRKIIGEFNAPGSRAPVSIFREPWFVQYPGSTEEDGGVVLTMAGDVATNSTTLYIIDAKSFKLLGQAEIPTFIPFGFHNRFYTKDSLGSRSFPKRPEVSPQASPVNGQQQQLPQVKPVSTSMETSRGFSGDVDNQIVNWQSSVSPKNTFPFEWMNGNFQPTGTGSQIFKGNFSKTDSGIPVENAIAPSNVDGINNVAGGTNIAEDNFGIPSTSIGSMNWANVVEQGKKLVCTLFKEAIDKSGSRFCENKNTAN